MITLWRRNMNKNLQYGGAFVLSVVILLVVTLMISFPAMLLWNAALVPAISILNPVDWVQMWCIVMLINLLARSQSPINVTPK